MKSFLSAVLMIAFIVSPGFGQVGIYLGLEGGDKFDLLKVNDEKGYIKTDMDHGSNLQYGFNVMFDIQNKFLLETGIYKNTFSESFYFEFPKAKIMEPSLYNSAFVSWNIPLRMKKRFNILKEKLFVTPFIGCSVSTNLYKGLLNNLEDTLTSGTFTNATDSVFYSMKSYKLNKFHLLIESGFSIDFLLFQKIYLQLITGYNIGLKNYYRIDVLYEMNDIPATSGTVYSKGNSIYFLMGLKFPIST